MAKSKSTTAPAQTWAPQAAGLTDLYGRGQELLGQPAQSQLQQQAGEQALQYGSGQPLQNIIGGAQKALGMSLDPSQRNPYLQKAMQTAINPLTQAYQENVLGGITDEAVQAGQTGSSRQGIAEGIAGREYLQKVGDITSGMAYQDYGAGMDRMGRAIGQAGAVANLGMMPSTIAGRVGGAQQAAPWQQLQRQKGLLGAPTVLGGGGASTGGTTSALGWL